MESKMDGAFFGQWFRGFEAGLDAMAQEERSRFLGCCARKCADTGVLQSYRKLLREVNSHRNAFYRRLYEVGKVRGEIVVPDREYYICFPECSCDLHTAGDPPKCV